MTGIQYETKSYYFMTIAEWFYVDENFKIKLTELGKRNQEAVKSYQEYLENFNEELQNKFINPTK